ncbi:taste receptor type 2 member 7-like [Osmerus eperlanus]|uniref:taste receptor type 2 member 7-like n=1 Tax=Osmerus eperlanus TaxID=29151 RepID=UPI002E13913F
MTYSWSRTVVYLRRHMKSIVDSSSSFSQPQLEAQMRVAVLGIVQSVMLMFQLAYQTVILLMVLKLTVLPLVSGVEFILEEIFYLSSFFSLTSVTWLSFFYFINIVPNTGKCFIWMKGHIKMVVYVIMGLEKLFMFIYECIYITSQFIVKKQPFNSTTLNATLESSEINEFFSVNTIFMIIHGTYLLACFVTMTYSWSRTVVYLRRHMKSIVDSSSSFSQPQLEAQMRVAVLGIVQSVILMAVGLWGHREHIFMEHLVSGCLTSDPGHRLDRLRNL